MRSLHVGESPVQPGSRHLVLAHAEGGRFAEDQIEQRFPLGRHAEHGEERAGPLFLHLHRSDKRIQRPAFHQFLRQRAEQFRAGVVHVALQHRAEIGGRGVLNEQREPENVRAVVQLAMAEPVPDGLDPRARKRGRRGRPGGQQRRAGRCHQFVGFVRLHDRPALQQFEGGRGG